MPALLIHDEHLGTRPVSPDIERIINDISSDLTSDDFKAFSKGIQYSMKRTMVKRAEELIQKLGGTFPVKFAEIFSSFSS